MESEGQVLVFACRRENKIVTDFLALLQILGSGLPWGPLTKISAPAFELSRSYNCIAFYDVEMEFLRIVRTFERTPMKSGAFANTRGATHSVDENFQRMDIFSKKT